MYNSGGARRGQNPESDCNLENPLKKPEPRTAPPSVPPLRLAVELRETRIVAALVDERARRIAAGEIEAPPSSARAAAAAAARLMIEIAGAPERRGRTIDAIGVAVPGWVDPADGRLTVPGRTGWLRIALGEMIERELTVSGIDLGSPPDRKHHRAERRNSAHPSISMHSRAAALVAAEAWAGAGRPSRNAVYMDISDRIEAGFLVDGRVLGGAAGRAGAVGWLGLSEQYREEFAARGCLTFEAGRSALVRRVIESWTGGTASLLERLSAADASQISPLMVLRAAKAGDALAERVLKDICNWIGRGVADLISTLAPDVVVLGGDFGGALKPFYGELRREVRRWAHPAAVRQCRVVPAALGADAAVIGAARLAAQKEER